MLMRNSVRKREEKTTNVGRLVKGNYYNKQKMTENKKLAWVEPTK